MTTERVVVIGGSSGMGHAVAEQLVAAGADVTVASRSAERLAATLPGKVRTFVADVAVEADVRRLFADVGPIDHVVVTAADGTGAYQPVRDLDVAAVQRWVDIKLYGALLVAKHAAPVIRGGGSITYTSGIAAYRPMPGGAVVAAVNGGLDAMVAALAVELAPLRVNAVSPGWVDTPIWDAVAGEAKTERLAAMGDRLLTGRIGTPADIAAAVLALVHNGFITGTVLHADGGHRLV